MTRTGAVALGLLGVGAAMFVSSRSAPSRRMASRGGRKCRVVIAGAGFGGLTAATRLAGNARIDLTVVDAHDHHLFQPLLYQVATAALSPSDIAAPVRGILPVTPGVRVLKAPVTGIDMAGRRLHCGGTSIPYDELIVATGSRPSYFGHETWAESAPSLKTLDDALDLRRAILGAFEHADATDQGWLLTFILIGGGPTGVEMAGAIAELTRDMRRRGVVRSSAQARVVLVEGGPRILSSFAPELSSYAQDTLRSMGVELREGTKVTGIRDGVVQLHDETIRAGTVIWTAGTEATPVAQWLGVDSGQGGRVEVGADLRLPGHPEIAVIGDAALARAADGKALPGLAPVAKQQGGYVARAILRRLRGAPSAGPFAYRDYGTLATIGRNRAVAELGRFRIEGVSAWLLWAAAHIFFLIGFRNRFMVLAQWAFAYAANARPGQLVIGSSRDRDADGN